MSIAHARSDVHEMSRGKTPNQESMQYIVMARKNEPCFERCLLRRHEKNHKTGIFCMSARQAIHRTGLFFYFQPNKE